MPNKNHWNECGRATQLAIRTRLAAVFKTASMSRKLTVTPEDEQLPHLDVREVEVR
jgi:hypothetical protein